MKKIIIMSILAFFLLGSSIAVGSSINGSFEGNPIVNLIFGGKELTAIDTPAIIYNNRVMVPLNLLRQAGFDVTWNSNDYSVSVKNIKVGYNSNLDAAKNTVAKLQNHQSVNIIFFGDSTTEQNDKTQGFDNHVKEVENALKVKYPNTDIHVYNKGISQHTSSDGLQRFKTDVLDLNPDLVVICFGINDATHSSRKLEVSQFKSNMDTMIKTLTDQGKEIIIRTTNPLGFDSPVDQYNDVSRKLANKYNIGLCDIYNKFDDLAKQGISIFPALTTDKMHPNAIAQILMTEELVKFFK